MGYGGPRVGFQTSTEHANHTATIQHEDAARVRDIVDRSTNLPASEQLRLREEAFRNYEAAQAADAARTRAEASEAIQAQMRQEARGHGKNGTRSAAEVTARRSRQARLTQLAQPRERADMHLSGTARGYVMHTHGKAVDYPVGRNGAPYTPGVDRDRVVPPRPQLSSDNTPPWIGSYSTHHGARGKEDARAAAREAATYHCGSPSPPRSAEEEAKRQQVLRELTAALTSEAPQQGGAAGRADTSAEGQAAATPPNCAAVEDSAVSVFSHGSSNGPINATGNSHMYTTSTKESVQLHLSRYGGAMTAPRPQRTAEKISVESLTLPELSHRLVKMQVPASHRS